MYVERFRWMVGTSCVLLTAFACSSPQRDLGQIGDAGADTPSEMERSEQECPVAPREKRLEAPRQAAFLSEFVGLWIGQTEDALGDVNQRGRLPLYAFPSGSTRILLEVSHAERASAELIFGSSEPAAPASDQNLGSLREGAVYSAKPVASAVDMEHSGADEAAVQQLALDGKLVLAFWLHDPSASATDRDGSSRVSELHLRFAGDGLTGVFDGLSLLNERGFLTKPGRVHFRRADGGEAP